MSMRSAIGFGNLTQFGQAPSFGTLGTVATWFARTIADASHAAARRRDAQLLSQMDEAQLNDLGITRSEIEHAVRYGRRA